MVGVFYSAPNRSLGLLVNCELFFLWILAIGICRVDAIYNGSGLVLCQTFVRGARPFLASILDVARHFKRFSNSVCVQIF